MDSFEDNSWDLIDYSSFIDDVASTDLGWSTQSPCAEFDASLSGTKEQDNECLVKDCSRKRGRNDSCSRLRSKSCRERQRRERLNESFLELSSTLDPQKPAKTDKLAILGDAIRVLNQLRTESQEYKDTNEKLLGEIKALKAEKSDLREEKLMLKADKEKMEQQLKVMTASPAGFMPAHPAAYQAGLNKMAVFPGYSFVPMWQYLPPSAHDTSNDPELRPPAA